MKKLNQKQMKLLEAMLTESTFEASYKKAGISKPTALKYRDNPDFKEAYRTAKRRMMENVTTKLQRASFEAVEVLSEIMNDELSPATARIQGAKAVLENAYKGIELEDLAERLEEVERFMDEQEGG